MHCFMFAFYQVRRKIRRKYDDTPLGCFSLLEILGQSKAKKSLLVSHRAVSVLLYYTALLLRSINKYTTHRQELYAYNPSVRQEKPIYILQKAPNVWAKVTQDICSRNTKRLSSQVANICLEHNIMSREIKTNTAWAAHLPISTSSLFISVQRNLQQLLLLQDSSVKGIQTEREKQNLPISPSFAAKPDAPCPLGEEAASREKHTASSWVTCWRCRLTGLKITPVL